MPFQPGQSGNPKGKTPGTRNRTTVMLEQLFEDEAGAIARMVVEQAKNGELAAAKLVLERLVPPAKERTIRIELPRVEKAADLPIAMAAVIAAVAEGELAPHEGQALQALLEGQRKAIETLDLATRLSALEGRLA
jgi:hypothetical protein